MPRCLWTMTAHRYPNREITDLLERILERVESIDRVVEEICDELEDRSTTYKALLDDSFEDENGYH